MSSHQEDRRERIISDLSVLASLRGGQTLSTSTMKVLTHKNWSSAAWRTYSGENRKDTINFIKGILNEALDICDLSSSHDLEKVDIIVANIESSLKGFSMLKTTYSGDYYIISDIDRIINDTKRRLSLIKQRPLQHPSITNIVDDYQVDSESDPTLKQCVQEIVRSKLSDDDIEFGTLGNIVMNHLPEEIIHQKSTISQSNEINSSDTEKMVPLPNRDSVSETVEDPIYVNNTSTDSKDSDVLPDITDFPVTKSDNTDFPVTKSDNTVEIDQNFIIPKSIYINTYGESVYQDLIKALQNLINDNKSDDLVISKVNTKPLIDTNNSDDSSDSSDTSDSSDSSDSSDTSDSSDDNTTTTDPYFVADFTNGLHQINEPKSQDDSKNMELDNKETEISESIRQITKSIKEITNSIKEMSESIEKCEEITESTEEITESAEDISESTESTESIEDNRVEYNEITSPKDEIISNDEIVESDEDVSEITEFTESSGSEDDESIVSNEVISYNVIATDNDVYKNDYIRTEALYSDQNIYFHTEYVEDFVPEVESFVAEIVEINKEGEYLIEDDMFDYGKLNRDINQDTMRTVNSVKEAANTTTSDVIAASNETCLSIDKALEETRETQSNDTVVDGLEETLASINTEYDRYLLGDSFIKKINICQKALYLPTSTDLSMMNKVTQLGTIICRSARSPNSQDINSQLVSTFGPKYFNIKSPSIYETDAQYIHCSSETDSHIVAHDTSHYINISDESDNYPDIVNDIESQVQEVENHKQELLINDQKRSEVILEMPTNNETIIHPINIKSSGIKLSCPIDCIKRSDRKPRGQDDVDSVSPILRLAKAFKQWVEKITSDPEQLIV